MKRIKIKGANRHVNKKDYEGEPNFYTMPPIRTGTFPSGAVPPGGGASVTFPGTAGAQPIQASPRMPYAYPIQTGFVFPPMQPGPFTAAQMPSGDAAATGQGNPQQQQPMMYAYPPFYGYPPPWMQQQQQQQPMGSLPSSPEQASAPQTPTTETTGGGEEETPSTTEELEQHQV